MLSSALALGLLLAGQETVAGLGPGQDQVSAPWVSLEYGGASYGGETRNRVVFRRQVTVGPNGMPLPRPAPVWFVRKDVSRSTGLSPAGEPPAASVQWIDGRTCPGLATVMADLEHLPTFSPYPLAKLAKPFPDPPPTHSSSWILSRWGLIGGAESNMTITDPSGAVIGKWWVRAEKTLAPCWRNAQPRYP